MAEATDNATTRLARYALDLDVAQLPEGILSQARYILADTIGVLYAASRRPAVLTALRALTLGNGPCTVVGHGRLAAPEVAAFINGIGGHDIELDDLHAASRTHPAAVIVPAALAAAELSNERTFGDLLAAIVAGYEVEVRVAKAIGPNTHYDRGFHPSAVCGSIGAAVCAGRILALSVDQMCWCIGLAASQSSGLLSYYDDPFHMAKSFQTGIASRNGVTAALFAAQDYRTAPDVLAGKNNVLKSFGGTSADATRLVADLGMHFEIAETSFKRHACCALTHSAADALLLLIEDSRITADQIQHIDVRLPHNAVPMIDGNNLWTHNIQYVLALAAHQGRIELEHFSPEWTGDPQITQLAAHVTVKGSDELQTRFPEQIGAIVTVDTPDGEFVRQCDAPRGSPGEPLTTRELSNKFLHVAGPVLSHDTAMSLWDVVNTTDPGESPNPLLAILSASR